jgi:hypothetical protein
MRNRAVTEIYRAVAVVVDAFVFENPHELRQRIREDPPDGVSGWTCRPRSNSSASWSQTFPNTTQTPAA